MVFIDVKKLWIGAAAAAVAYLALYILAVALLLLTFGGLAAAKGGNVIPASSPGIPGQPQLDVWSMVGQLAAQLVAMAHLGGPGVAVEGAVPLLGAIRGNASAYAVPLGILAISIFAVYTASRIAEFRAPSGTGRQLIAQSLVTGVVYSALVNSVAAAAAITYPASSGVMVSPISAANFWSILISLCLGFAASMLARRRAYTRGTENARTGWMRTLNLAYAAVGTHLLLFTAIGLLTVWILAFVTNGWAGLLSAPLWSLNAAGFLLVAGHLGGLRQYSAYTVSVGGSANRSEDQLIYGFGGGVAGGAEPWLVLGALALAILCTVLSGTVVLLRRGETTNTTVSGWLPIPAAYLVLGLALLPLLSTSVHFSLGGMAVGAAGLAPVWWSPAVFLLWGLFVELCARFVSPYVLPFLPATVRRIAQLGMASDPSMENHATGTLPYQDPDSKAEPDGPEPGVSHRPAFTEPVAKKLSPVARKRALAVMAAVALVAVLAGAGLVAINVAKASNGPDKRVSAYMQALVDGDAEKAMSISDPGIASEERALLTNAVYATAGKRIDGFTVLSTAVLGDSATVRVEVRQDGRKSEVPFTLTKDHPQLLDDNWKLKSNGFNMVGLSADADVAAFSVNGVTINNFKATSSGLGSALSLPAFPGEYVIGLPKTEKYISAKEERLLVTIGSSVGAAGSARLEVGASDELQGEVSRQVDAAWAACAASTELNPAGCPFYSFASGETRNVKWTITDKPKYSLRKSYDGTWRLATETAGKATVRYDLNSSFRRDQPDWKPESKSVRFSTYGSVTAGSAGVEVKLSGF